MLHRLSERATELCGNCIGDAYLSLTFLSSEEMAEVNMSFLSHEGDTDVICFDYRESCCCDDGDEVATDLIICPAVAEREAKKRGLDYSEELTLYLVHGLLHASGYDDLQPGLKRKMRVAERRVMTELKKEFGLRSIFPEPEK